MADVSSFKALASSLIQANGQQVQIKRVTDGAVGSTPWKPAAPAEALETVYGAVLGIKDAKTEGTLVQRGDRLVLVSAVDVTGPAPTTADYVLIGGVQHKIVDVDVVSPSGDDVLYKLQVRQ